MGCIVGQNITICGNFAKLTRRKPKGYNKDYKIIIPYPFKWREKIGGIECDCTEVEEHFQPWYGFDWYHSPTCAILKRIERHPGIQNLFQFAERDFRHIAASE